MAFATLEDRGGEIELIIFPKVLAACGAVLRQEAIVTTDAEISLKDGEPKLIVRSAQHLETNDHFRPVTAAPTPLPTGREYGAGQPSVVQKTVTRPSPMVPEPDDAGKPEASNSAATPKKLWLKVTDMEGKTFIRALALCEIFSGETPLVFYDLSRKKYISAGIGVAASAFLLAELREVLGSDSVVLR